MINLEKDNADYNDALREVLIENFFGGVFAAVIILLFYLFTSCSSAEAATYVRGKSYKLLELDRSDLRIQKFEHRRDPYTPQYDGLYIYKVALDWDLSIAKYFFWRNTVHTEAVEQAVKTVGWHWFLGVSIPVLNVELFHEHHSQHVMDERGPVVRETEKYTEYMKYPVEDSYGIRFKLYSKDS